MNNVEIIPVPTKVKTESPRRLIAKHIRDVGHEKEIYVDAMGGKKMLFSEYLAIMLWDLVTGGEAYFADGTKLMIEEGNVKQWLEVVKFMGHHIDGGAQNELTNFGQINIVKVYAGFDQEMI